MPADEKFCMETAINKHVWALYPFFREAEDEVVKTKKMIFASLNPKSDASEFPTWCVKYSGYGASYYINDHRNYSQTAAQRKAVDWYLNHEETMPS
jgi:hypothetical protein